MPDLSHLWQRFVLASALILGLAVGVAATIFGYSNTGTVTIGWSIYHVGGVPLWSVAIVPLAVALVVGTLYHWWNSLHHFTQHMHHRRRVRELEAEVASLKEHLDHMLEMPDQAASALPAGQALVEEEPEAAAKPVAATPALPEPANGSNGSNGAGSDQADKADRSAKRSSARRRVTLTTESEPETVAAGSISAPATEPGEEANSEA